MLPLVPILKGLASYIPGLYSLSTRGTEPTLSARYCYSVWLRHLIHARQNGLQVRPRRVGELGPGCSIGVGLAALISGASEYYALDVVRYAAQSSNLQVFDDLVELFRKKADVPGPDEFPDVKPALDSYRFPSDLFTDEILAESLKPSRLEELRKVLADGPSASGSFVIQYVAPWTDPSTIRENSLDLLYSQAVLEHIDALEEFYGCARRWLRNDGVMSHQIDFKSHGTASRWNGHWTYTDAMWKLIRGRRNWLINRQPYSVHSGLLKKHGFDVVLEKKVSSPSSVQRGSLAPAFASMSDEDLVTSGAFVQARLQKESGHAEGLPGRSTLTERMHP